MHNLRDIDVDIPRDRFVVLTGVSGSGKSSLAFDTLHAEGQRRYIESLSVYARQFLDQLERPDIDTIDGLPPTVAIEQNAGSSSPRSTVATITEAYDYLRLLYARAGVPHCPSCEREIRRQPPEQIVSSVLAMQDGRKVIVMAPLVRGRKGQHATAFDAIRRAGLIRARVDGEYVEIQEAPKLAKSKEHTIEAVVDRLVVREGIRPRLAESVDRALKLGDGTLLLSIQNDDGSWIDRVLSVNLSCPECGIGLEEMEPRSFSFNSSYGACPSCEGLGQLSVFDPELVLPDPSQVVRPETLPFWTSLPPRQAGGVAVAIEGYLRNHKADATTPRSRWSRSAVQKFLHGEATFPGLLKLLDSIFEQTRSEPRRQALASFRSRVPCPACQGARLRPEARAVTVDGMAIPQITALPSSEAISALTAMSFEPPLDQIGPPLVREVILRLEYLERVGLGYLTLDRPTDTLSGGEFQRVRLASQIGSGLVGVGFILDEPTAGLHPRDTDRLLDSLRALRDAGNSLVVVEHDEPTIRAADWVLDLGPGAGPDGGRVVAQGTPDQLDGPESLTARYLRSQRARRRSG